MLIVYRVKRQRDGLESTSLHHGFVDIAFHFVFEFSVIRRDWKLQVEQPATDVEFCTPGYDNSVSRCSGTHLGVFLSPLFLRRVHLVSLRSSIPAMEEKGGIGLAVVGLYHARPNETSVTGCGVENQHSSGHVSERSRGTCMACVCKHHHVTVENRI